MIEVAPIWILRAAEGFVLVVGALISYASFRAYARNRDGALGLLGAGFAVVTIAAVLAGVLYEVTTHDLLTAWTVSAALDCLGFSLILYSIARPREIVTTPAVDAPADTESGATGPRRPPGRP